MNSEKRKTIYIADLKEGQNVADLFLISRKNLAETKNGKPYLALAVMDKSGTMEARIWDDASRLDALTEVGQVVALEGQVKQFREQLQMNISALRPMVEGSVPLDCFMPASRRSVPEMKAELVGLIDAVSDSFLHTLLTSIFRGKVLKEFSMAPAAKMMHHAYLGGLLEHTLSVTGLAVRLAEHYPGLDRDMLIAAALLHDLGKIEEFSFTTVPFDYTDSGRLIGHLVLGSEMVRREAGQIDGFPPKKLDRLIHLILSHHGRHEFGSPSLPMTLEAILLHHLDDMDAKVNYIGRLSEQVASGTYQWSDFQRPLERFLLLRGRQEDTIEDGDEPNSRPDRQVRKDPEEDGKDFSDESSRQQTLF